MISFDNIEKYSGYYRFLNYFLRFYYNHIYYENNYVIDRENIPAKGEPVMVIANHQNGLMDALAVLYLFDDNRQPVFIARGDIFKKDRLAKILRFLKILPTFRTRDGGVSDIKMNNLIFSKAADILKQGGTIAMFPEAGHQSGHYMSTFKKGFPRIAFAAEEAADFSLHLKILPLNIHYSNYFSCRNQIMVTVGKPFTFEEFFEEYKTDPNLAYLALNSKARAAVKEMTPDIDVPEYYAEIDLLCSMYRLPRMTEKQLDPDYLPNWEFEDMAIIEDIMKMREDNQPAFIQLMNLTREYREGLSNYHLRDWLIGKEISTSWMVKHALLLVVLSPLVLFGYVTNAPAFELSAFVRKKIKDPMLHSSVNFVISFFVSLVWYFIIFILSTVICNVFFALLLSAVMTFSFFVFYSCKKKFIKLKGAWHYVRMKRKGMMTRLIELKSSILKINVSLLSKNNRDDVL